MIEQPTTETSNMAKALRGDPVEITLSRLHEMREQCVAGAMYTPGLPGWRHWHWVAVLNEVIAKRAAPEPGDCKDCDKLMTERDDATDQADKLAECIKGLLGIDIGEHSSGNAPWQNAIDAAEYEIDKRKRAALTKEAKP